MSGARSFRFLPDDYLAMLFRVEPHIVKEPAASAYWRLRSEVEQVIRQSQLEDEAIAQDP